MSRILTNDEVSAATLQTTSLRKGLSSVAMAVTDALDIRSLAKQDAYKYTEKDVHDLYEQSGGYVDDVSGDLSLIHI